MAADTGDIDFIAGQLGAATAAGDDEAASAAATALVVTFMKDLRRIAVAVERLVGDPPTHVNTGLG
jgi:hypothetical protein